MVTNKGDEEPFRPFCDFRLSVTGISSPVLVTLISSLVLAAAAPTAAQQYPSRPIRVVVPFAPGGPVDTITRIVSEHMQRTLGQPIVIENVAGAGGTTGSTRAMRATPDGYTILANSSAHTVAPWIVPNFPFDLTKDLSGALMIGQNANILIVSPAKGWKTVQDLVAKAHQVCPYSNATRGNIDVTLTIV